MKKALKKFSIIFIAVISICFTQEPLKVYAKDRDDIVFLGGYVAGFTIDTKGVTVIGYLDVLTKDGLKCPAKDAGLSLGDIILNIDDCEINCANDIEKSLSSTEQKVIKIDRSGEILYKNITPAQEINNKYKLGIFIKENIFGVGTITFIKNDKFASLGHPVLSDNNEIQEINGGKLHNCKIIGLTKGERGKPGELKGVFNKNENIGSIVKNIDCGIYGTISDFYNKKVLMPIEVGQGKVGDAKIISTIDENGPKEYDISIVKVDTIFSTLKNYVIKVNDKELLEKTGGIVQGMSGSPIVQDGKIVGAVTHVFINDPERGFGTSIYNMLKEID